MRRLHPKVLVLRRVEVAGLLPPGPVAAENRNYAGPPLLPDGARSGPSAGRGQDSA